MSTRRRSAGDIVLRLLAASVGGYALASLAGIALAFAMPWCCGWSRAEGVLAGSLLSFIAYLAAALWAFATRSLVVMGGLVVAGIGLLLLLWFS